MDTTNNPNIVKRIPETLNPLLDFNSIKQVSKYFGSNNDYINLIKVCSKFRLLLLSFDYNPISDPILFDRIKTQHFYKKYDSEFKIRGLDKYIYHYEIDYLDYMSHKEKDGLEKDNVIYMNVRLRNHRIVRLNNNGNYFEDDMYNIIYDDWSEKKNEKCNFTPLPIDKFDDRRHLTIPNGITTVDYKAFNDCCIDEVIFPCTIKEICDCSFMSNLLDTVVLPTGLIRIGDYAFNDNTNLKHLELPSTLEWIGRKAFNSCNLDSVVINSNYVVVCYFAFDQKTMIEFNGSMIYVEHYHYPTTKELCSYDKKYYRIKLTFNNNVELIDDHEEYIDPDNIISLTEDENIDDDDNIKIEMEMESK